MWKWNSLAKLAAADLFGKIANFAKRNGRPSTFAPSVRVSTFWRCCQLALALPISLTTLTTFPPNVSSWNYNIYNHADSVKCTGK
jgi:hypothetical protein